MKKIILKISFLIIFYLLLSGIQNIFEVKFVLDQSKILAQQLLSSDSVYIYNSAIEHFKWVFSPFASFTTTLLLAIKIFYKNLKEMMK